MKSTSILILVFSVFFLSSCGNNSSKDNSKDSSKNNLKDSPQVALVKSFVEARNSFDTDKLISLTAENYKESFKKNFVEVKSRQELLNNLVWAKELSSKTTIKKVISANESQVIQIEESRNYIDIALKKKPRTFKTTYYLKDGIILKQNFDDAPGVVFDNKANDRLYGDFERYCKVRNIKFSWNPTKEDGITLRKALEKYANRKE